MDRQELVDKSKRYVWLSFGRDESWLDRGPMITRGEAGFIFDANGDRLFDVGSGQGAVTLGYNNRHIVAAMTEQMNSITANASGWPVSPAMVRLAEKIASLSPGSLSKTFLTCNGTDANETAVKIARQYWRLCGKGGKYKVVSRWGGYHGSSLAMTAASGYAWRRKSFEPLPNGFIHIKPPTCYRCPYGLTYPSCGVECAEEFRKTVEYEDPSSVAAYIGELTIAGGGVIPPPPGYTERIREICERYEILMIVDEVVTGFGKTGNWFESQHYGIVPDMITFGKGVSGGYAALSGVHVKTEIAEAFQGASDNWLHHGYTHGGTPLACAAALAAIDYIETNELIAQVPDKHRFFLQRIEPLLKESPIVGDIRSQGLMFGIDLVKDKTTKAPFPNAEQVKDALIQVARQNGIHIASLGTRMHYFLPLIITFDELAWLAEATGRIVLELEKRFA